MGLDSSQAGLGGVVEWWVWVLEDLACLRGYR